MSEKEIEAVFYCDIGDPAGLGQADQVIKQEQCETEFANGSRARVRRSEEEGRISYEMTMKSKELSAGGPVQETIETTTPISKDFYTVFRSNAKHRLDKTRYVFNSKSVVMSIRKPEGGMSEVQLNNIAYEVDVYRNAEGKIIGFCKVDVEVHQLLAQLKEKFPDEMPGGIHIKLSHLPFKPQNIIDATKRTEEEAAKIDEFWGMARLPV